MFAGWVTTSLASKEKNSEIESRENEINNQTRHDLLIFNAIFLLFIDFCGWHITDQWSQIMHGWDT